MVSERLALRSAPLVGLLILLSPLVSSAIGSKSRAFNGQANQRDLVEQDDASALRKLDEEVEKNPSNVHSYLQRGLVRGRVGDPKGAISDFTQALGLNPKNAEALAYRGRVRYATGDREGGKGDLTKAIQVDPEFVLSYSYRALVYRDEGKYDKALADHARAIQLAPRDAFAHASHGKTLLAIEDNEGADRALTKAIVINGNDSVTYCDRARARGRMGRIDEAIADFTRAIEINPKEANAYNGRGTLLLISEKDLKGAVENLEKAVELEPETLAWLEGRCAGYYKVGRLKEALQDANAVVQLAPENSRAYTNRAGILNSLDEFKSAFEDSTRAIALDKKDIMAYVNRSAAALRMEAWKDAIEDATEAIKLDPKNLQAYLNRGYSHEKNGEPKSAIGDYESALRLAPQGWPQRNAVAESVKRLKKDEGR